MDDLQSTVILTHACDVTWKVVTKLILTIPPNWCEVGGSDVSLSSTKSAEGSSLCLRTRTTTSFALICHCKSRLFSLLKLGSL